MKTMSHRKIGGISLINTGLKGVIITYETEEIIKGVSYRSEDNKKSFRPAHRELKGYVKELVPHLMELSGYTGKELKMKQLDFEVTGIKAGSDRFLITGKFKCWGDKVIAVNTPLIKEVDGYEGYEKVIELTDKIYSETDLYLRGVKNIRSQDVIEDYMKDIKKRETFVATDFENMTMEEQNELIKEFDKDLGISVSIEDGKMVIGSSDEHEEEFIAEITTEQELKSSVFVVPEEEEQEKVSNEIDIDDLELPI